MSELGPSPHSSHENNDIQALNELYNLDPIEDKDRNTAARNNEQGDSSSGTLESKLLPDNKEKFTFNPRETLAEVVLDSAKRFGEALTNRGEDGETGKEKMKRIGGNALRIAMDADIVTLGVTYLAVEATKDGVKIAAKKIVAIGKDAVANLKERRRTRQVNKIRRQGEQRYAEETEASYSENIAFTEAREAQDDAFTTYEPNVEYHQAHEKALETNAQKKTDQAEAYESYADNIATTRKREAQEEAFESYEENISASEALERRRAALKRKRARQARRQEIYGNARDKGSELWGKVKGRMGKIGRSALKTLKRGGKAVSAGVKAAAGAATTSWQETA